MKELALWLAFLGLGLVPLGAGLAYLWLQIRPYRWPVALGVIVDSRIEEMRGARPGERIYVPVMEVEYTHEGKTRRFQQRPYVAGTQESAQKKIDKYPVGQSVPIRFDPRNDDHACLEFGVTPESWVLILLGIGVLTALFQTVPLP